MKWEPISEFGKQAYERFGHNPYGAKKLGKLIFNEELYDELQHLRECLLYTDYDGLENRFEADTVFESFKEAKNRARARNEKAYELATQFRTLKDDIKQEMWEVSTYGDNERGCGKYYDLLESVSEQLNQIDKLFQEY